MLSTADPSALAGHPVQLNGLEVQRVVGDRLVVLNSSGGQSVCAVCSYPTQTLRAGDVVDVTGTIKQQTGSLSASGLTAEASQALGAQPFYIDAGKIKPTNK
jgi:hypothetical protein